MKPFYHRCEKISVIRRLQELARKKQIPLYVCFIDLTKAYDPVDRTLLKTVLARFGVPQNMISVVRQLHGIMRAARRQGVLGVVRCETRPSPRVHARAPPVQHLLHGRHKYDLHAFQGERCFGASEKKLGAGGAGESTTGEPVLAMPLWGMLYDDDAGVVLLSPEQLRKMMGVIEVK